MNMGAQALPLLTGAANSQYEGTVGAAGINAGATANLWNNISSIAGDWAGGQMAQTDEARILEAEGYVWNKSTGKWEKKPTTTTTG
jgi:hypothetical protein